MTGLGNLFLAVAVVGFGQVYSGFIRLVRSLGFVAQRNDQCERLDRRLELFQGQLRLAQALLRVGI